MKKQRLFWLIAQSCMTLIAVFLGGGVMAAVVTQGNVPEAEVTNPASIVTTEGGNKAVFPEQSVTLGQQAEGGTPEVYEPDYDKLITQVRIARTPLDQISRKSRNTKVKAMEFRYASIDYLPISTNLSADWTARGTSKVGDVEAASQSDPTEELAVTNANIFNRRDVIIVSGVTGGNGEDLKLWVVNRDGSTKIAVKAINGITVGSYTGQIPSIDKDDNPLIRIAKACAELDSQAPGYAILPNTTEQYCQKFMAQVEQSTIDALTAKRFDINLNDQEEATLADMRLGMEGSFLFGTKSKFTDPDTLRNVWTTGGIWNQVTASKSYNLTANDSDELTISKLIDWTKDMFTGPAAGKSNKRVVFCGSELLAALQKLFVNSQYITNTFKKWDLEFTEFTTTFGSFEFILDEVFDLHGMSKCGLIVDPDYLQRYTFEAFGRNTLDLDAQGTRDSKAIVLREISALVLKSPKNHAKIVFSA